MLVNSVNIPTNFSSASLLRGYQRPLMLEAWLLSRAQEEAKHSVSLFVTICLLFYMKFLVDSNYHKNQSKGTPVKSNILEIGKANLKSNPRKTE